MRLHRLLLPLMAAVTAGSCTPAPLLPGTPRSVRDPQGPTRRPYSADGDSLSPSHLYLTAIRFSDGYDWQRDSLPEARNAEVLLLRDGTLIQHFAAEEEIAPGEHWICGGHVYTLRPRAGRTFLLRDGRTLTDWEGRESVSGLTVTDGHVHTLGVGEGMTYRIDGVPVYHDPAGTPVGNPDHPAWPGGTLTLDGDCVCFAYTTPVIEGAQIRKEGRMVRDGQLWETVPAGSFSDLVDVRVRDGIIYRIENRNGSLYLVRGTQAWSLGKADHPYAFRLIPWEGALAAIGSLPARGGRRYLLSDGASLLWEKTLEGNAQWNGLWVDGTGWSAVQVSPEGLAEALWVDGTAVPLPENGFRLLSERSTTRSEGRSYTALTARNGTGHALWTDAAPTPLTFNGYFLEVRME